MTDQKAKQVIVIRRDLGMRRGKEIAQGAHASMAWLTSRLRSEDAEGRWVFPAHLSLAEITWIKGHFTKIVCQVPDQAELVAIYQAAKDAGLNAYLITDAGLTEFKEPTMTAVGIGPDWAEDIDKVTGELKLY